MKNISHLDLNFIKLSRNLSYGMTKGFFTNSTNAASDLKVFDVGSYYVSKVESVNDFDKSNKNVF